MIFRHRDPNAPEIFYICSACAKPEKFYATIGDDGGVHENCDHIPRGRLRLLRPSTGRCKVTGNPCGTDTWMEGIPCKCESCQAYLKGNP